MLPHSAEITSDHSTPAGKELGYRDMKTRIGAARLDAIAQARIVHPTHGGNDATDGPLLVCLIGGVEVAVPGTQKHLQADEAFAAFLNPFAVDLSL